MATCEIKIIPDFLPFYAALEKLESLAESSPELFQSGFGLPMSLDKAFFFESDPLPAGARELVVRLNPSEALLSFLATGRRL